MSMRPPSAVVKVLEDHHDRARRGEPLEEGAPRRKELVGRDRACVDAEKGKQGRLDPAAFGLVRHVLGDGRRDLGPRRRLVVGLHESGPPADHLAERPRS